MAWRDLIPDGYEWDSEAHHRFIEARSCAAAAFEGLPRDVHDRLVLEAIGAGSPRTRTEVTASIRERHPEFYVRSDIVHGALGRLCKSGEVARETGQWGPCRYRYFRLLTAGDVADLERALQVDVKVPR